jgi:plasmid maintenance system antidote protein VapI
MKPERFQECLDMLDWTQRGIAKRLDRPHGTIKQWLQGKVRIPSDVDIWLETLVGFHERHPPPQRKTPKTSRPVRM